MFEKLPPIKGEDVQVGCLHCSTAALTAPMDMVIAVGFGSAFVQKDGEIVYSEDIVDEENFWTVQDAEDAAKLDPAHDWQIVKYGPLHGETFQRQGDGLWVCVESNRGFA